MGMAGLNNTRRTKTPGKNARRDASRCILVTSYSMIYDLDEMLSATFCHELGFLSRIFMPDVNVEGRF